MGQLVDLLRWKKEITLKNMDGNPLRTVYLRIIGDYDLQESYRLARIASSKKRALLRDIESDDYKDEVNILDDATSEQCLEIILAAKSTLFENEAVAANERPELLEIETVAIDPDAPTLEEQEILDKKREEFEQEYQKKLVEYVETKKVELTTLLESLSLKEQQAMAKEELSNIVALGVFMEELNNQKVWRSTYIDKYFKERGYSSADEFRDAHPMIRNQLIDAYRLLEIGPEELKN